MNGLNISKYIFTIAIYVITLVSPTISFSAAWIDDKDIQYLYAGTIGNRYAVKLVGIYPNPDSCTLIDDLVIETNNLKLREMWAMLLTSYASGKPISLYLSGCNDQGRPIITDVRF